MPSANKPLSETKFVQIFVSTGPQSVKLFSFSPCLFLYPSSNLIYFGFMILHFIFYQIVPNISVPQIWMKISLPHHCINHNYAGQCYSHRSSIQFHQTWCQHPAMALKVDADWACPKLGEERIMEEKVFDCHVLTVYQNVVIGCLLQIIFYNTNLSGTGARILHGIIINTINADA